MSHTLISLGLYRSALQTRRSAIVNTLTREETNDDIVVGGFNCKINSDDNVAEPPFFQCTGALGLLSKTSNVDGFALCTIRMLS